MLRVTETVGFRRDFKKVQKRSKDVSKLLAVIKLLSQGKPLPARCRPHRLSGNWRGFHECHIEPDWLLIYELNPDELVLARTGSHADLFD